MMKIQEYADIAKRLAEFYSDDEATEWMTSPHPQLEGRRPVDCKFSEVAPILDRLESGAYL